MPTMTPKVFKVDTDRVKYWISVGAKPSDRVASLLKADGMADMEKYIGPRAKTRKKKKAAPEEPAAPAAPAAEAPAEEAAAPSEEPAAPAEEPAPAEEAPKEETPAE